MEKFAVQGMKQDEPSPQQARHTRKFDKAELAKALRFYLESNGHTVPNGEEYFYGLEKARDYLHDEECVTFVVREKDAAK